MRTRVLAERDGLDDLTLDDVDDGELSSSPRTTTSGDFVMAAVRT
jgi:hypothetical protein